MVLWEDAIISFVVFANCITYSLLFIEQLFLLRMNIVEKAARAYTGDTEFIYRSIITRWDSFLRESGISFLLDFNRFPWKKRYTQERWTMTVDNDTAQRPECRGFINTVEWTFRDGANRALRHGLIVCSCALKFEENDARERRGDEWAVSNEQCQAVNEYRKTRRSSSMNEYVNKLDKIQWVGIIMHNSLNPTPT